MTKRGLVVAVAAVVAIGAGAAGMQWFGADEHAAAKASRAAEPRVVGVEAAPAVKKSAPVLIEGLGNVTPIASVAVRTRIDSAIIAIHFKDGALVQTGDLLVTLDSRAVEAQIRQAEAQRSRDQAQLVGAERDLKRYTDLVARQATPQINLDNARTQADVYRAAIRASQALIDNLKVQLSYCTIRAPISGRISQANVKVGNIVRTGDLTPIATINQMAPVYVSFTVPQRDLPDVRQAVASGKAPVEVAVPGEQRLAHGTVTMIENTVDTATGMAMLRATMPNKDDLLWPGTLVTARLTLRTEQAVVVPAAAIQMSQQGAFVFVVEDGMARVRPVTVARTQGDDTILASGLKGGEIVVTDGHLQLTNGSRVTIRNQPQGSERRPLT